MVLLHLKKLYFVPILFSFVRLIKFRYWTSEQKYDCRWGTRSSPRSCTRTMWRAPGTWPQTWWLPWTAGSSSTRAGTPACPTCSPSPGYHSSSQSSHSRSLAYNRDRPTEHSLPFIKMTRLFWKVEWLCRLKKIWSMNYFYFLFFFYYWICVHEVLYEYIL